MNYLYQKIQFLLLCTFLIAFYHVVLSLLNFTEYFIMYLACILQADIKLATKIGSAYIIISNKSLSRMNNFILI